MKQIVDIASFAPLAVLAGGDPIEERSQANIRAPLDHWGA